MIHNSKTAPLAAAILERAKGPNGVTVENGIGAKASYFYKLAGKGFVFTTKASVGSEPKHYFDSQERADAWYAANPPKRKGHPKKAVKPVAYPVSFGSVRQQAGGPARLPGEPVITSKTKITIAPPPPAVLYRSNTFNAAG